MKKRLTLLATVVLALCSCEDFLVRTPQDRVSPEAYFRTETDCRLFTNQFYLMLEEAGDIYGDEADYIFMREISDEVRGSRLVPATSAHWNFDSLRDINTFLAYSGQCEDEAVRMKYIALARFFRAYFYSDMVRRFGDVPWIDRPLDSMSEELYKGRDSRKVVMDHVVEDLDYAIAHLPGAKNVYTVTKWTAMALKSRACLFEGTFRKYHGLGDWESMLNASADASSNFIKQSGYSLLTGANAYLNLFSAINSNSSEVILSRAYSAALEYCHDSNGRFTSASYGRPGVAKDVVNMYLCADGSRFTDKPGYETMEFFEETQGRDPRLAQTIRTPGYSRIGSGIKVAPNLGATMTGYQIIKYVTAEKYDSYKSSENDMPIFRTAEVYLNYAEAKAELGTISQADLDLSVNKLRSRASMPALSLADANASPDPYLMDNVTGFPNVSGPNTGVILEIRRERTVEMMCEGLRYWDIMRWKAGKRFERPFYGMYFPSLGSYDLDHNGSTDFVIYEGEKPASQEGVVYMSKEEACLSNGTSGYLTVHAFIERKWNEDKDYLYPVPLEEIELTGGAITQNPNWK